ncbi:MAG: SURF1 family cytochrome oxidase biogenesis protein, partial [Paracoccaceae bacterium]
MGREKALKRVAFILIVAVLGTGVLLSLGKWQLDRRVWKEAILRDINSRISDMPVSVPETPLPQRDMYLPVIEEG